MTSPRFRHPLLSPHFVAFSRKIASLPLVLALSAAAVTVVGCSNDAPTKDQLLVRASESLASNQFWQAEKQYRDVLRLAPNDPVAQRQLGILYFDQGQIVQALPLLKKSAELDPGNVELQLKLGVALLAAAEYVQSRDAALQILENHPGDEQALSLLIDTARSPDDLEATRKLIESYRQKAGQERASYHLALGAIYFKTNDQARAESEFKSALSLDPKSAQTYTSLGSLYWSRNDLPSADQAFKTASELVPPQSPVRLRQVDFKFRTGSRQEAKALLEVITQKVPEYLPALVYLMKIVCTEQQTEECNKRVQTILEHDPSNLEAVYQDGIINMGKGDAPKAIREFEYLSNAFPRNAQIRYDLARAYLLLAKNSNSQNVINNAINNAENRLSDAIKLDPQLDQAVLLFAELKIRKGSGAVAIDPLTQLIKSKAQIPQAYYLLASAYLSQQRTEEALAVYRQMTVLFPQDVQPPFLIGTLLLAQQDQTGARQAFEKSAEISPDFLPAIERLVDLDIAEQRFASALERAQAQIDKQSNSAIAWTLRGKVYLAQRDFDRAQSDLQKAIELDGNFEPAHLLLAQLYATSNRQEEAIKELSAFVANKKTIPALMSLALLYQNKQDFSAAVTTYEKLLSVNPNFAPALNNLAFINAEYLGQIDQALALAKRASAAAPNDFHVTDTLGWISFKKGDLSEARRLLQESANKLPDVSEIQFHLGVVLYMLGDEGMARAALQKAIEAPADFVGKSQALEKLAVLKVDIESTNSAAARNDLEKLIRQNPDDPVAQMKLAKLQEREGAVDQAIKAYEKIVASYPLFTPATRQLALLSSQRADDVAKAFNLAEKARQAYPNDPEVAKALGILNYRRDYYPRAVDLLKEAAAKRPEDAEILYYLGETHRQLKQWAECKNTLERAASLRLPSALADRAKAALANCEDSLAQ